VPADFGVLNRGQDGSAVLHDDDQARLLDVEDEPVPLDPSSGAGDERSSLRTGMGFAATSFISNVVVQLLSSVLTARLYGVDVIGEYALVTAPWLTLIQFSNVDEQTALVRDLAVLPARDVRVGRLFFAVFGFSVGLTTLVAAIVGGLSVAALRGPVDAPHLVVPSLLVLVGYVVIENTSWNMDSVFSAFRAGREIFIARFVQATSFLVFSIGLRTLSSSVWPLAIATVVSFFLAFCTRVVMVRRYLSWVSLAEIRQGVRELPRILKFGVRLLPGGIAGGVAGQASTWLLGALSDVTTLGAFSRAAGVAIRIQDAGFRLSEMVFPSLVERHHHADRAGMRDDLSFALRSSGIPLLGLAAVGGGVAAGALSIFGSGFEQADDALAFLLVAYAISVLTLITGIAMVAQDRPLLTTSLVVVRSVLIVGFLVPGVVWWGATGAAAGFALAYVIDLVIRAVLVRRMVFDGHLGAVGRSALSVIAAFVPAFAVARVLDVQVPRPFGTITGGVVGFLVYAGVIVLTRGVTADERRRTVAAVQRRIRDRRRQPATP
jgi:O-antigen/teichoic acid export membrane protein